MARHFHRLDSEPTRLAHDDVGIARVVRRAGGVQELAIPSHVETAAAELGRRRTACAALGGHDVIVQSAYPFSVKAGQVPSVASNVSESGEQDELVSVRPLGSPRRFEQ